MLSQLTAISDWVAMSLALWLSAYLLIRSHRSRTTLRAVLILAALAAAFLIAYIGLYDRSARLANAWAAALTLAIVLWYDLTYHWLSPARQAARRRVRWAIIILGAAKIVYLLVIPADAGLSATSGLSALSWRATWLSIADAAYLLISLIAAASNLRLERQAAAVPHFRLMWIAAWLGAAASAYGMLTSAWPDLFPRLVQNLLLVGALGLLGYAIARYQAFVGRHTTLHDFPVSGLTVLGLAVLYGLIARNQGFTTGQVVLVTVLAILSHAGYDLVREVLDRLLHQRESELRQQLRELAQTITTETSLAENLEQGLAGAAVLLNASGAFVAQHDADYFLVLASHKSLALGTALPASELLSDDVREAPPALAGQVSWLAPVHVGLEQVAAVGVGPRNGSTTYAAADIDLLVEVADWASRLFEADRRQRESRAQVLALAQEVERSAALEPAGNLIEQLVSTPGPDFVRLVEDALRHIDDYNSLGGSSLADQMGVEGATHIDRGKTLRAKLTEAVETLRPVGSRPAGILPREWHSYAILYDAYIEDVPNREIMARLYISEGTFNRLRRKALQAVGRTLWEHRQPINGGRGVHLNAPTTSGSPAA
jgi:hypothetical protein